MRSNKSSSSSNKNFGRNLNSRLKLYYKLFFSIRKYEKIVIHGVFDPFLSLVLLLNFLSFKKYYWVLWGGDMYSLIESEQIKINSISDFIRYLLISRIENVLTYIYGDYEIVKNKFNSKAKFCECLMYPSNTFESNKFQNKSLKKRVLIGNSADKKNNHYKIIDKLYPFKKLNIEVYCPLSYGPTEHAKNVVDYGLKKLGKQFIPMNKFLPLNDYKKFLNSIDIAIFAHDRQQGMGNLITLLGSGATVFLGENISTYKFFKNLKINVNSFEKFIFKEISIQEKNNNIKIVSERFTLKILTENWKKIYE